MNGSENSYAGAIFFALMSLGAFLKLDDSTGWIFGVTCALFAAILLRRGFVKTSQSVEENHQRMEVQFQQLRNKIAETVDPTVTAMNSVNNAAQFVQENMQILTVRLDGLKGLDKLNGLNKLDELEGLTRLTENFEAIRSIVAMLEENSSALNAELEKFFIAIQNHESFATITEELRKISAIDATNCENIQNVVDMLQYFGQSLQNSTYAADLNRLIASVDSLNEKINELVKINAAIAKGNSLALDAEDLDLLKKIAEKITAK